MDCRRWRKGRVIAACSQGSVQRTGMISAPQRDAKWGTCLKQKSQRAYTIHAEAHRQQQEYIKSKQKAGSRHHYRSGHGRARRRASTFPFPSPQHRPNSNEGGSTTAYTSPLASPLSQRLQHTPATYPMTSPAHRLSANSALQLYATLLQIKTAHAPTIQGHKTPTKQVLSRQVRVEQEQEQNQEQEKGKRKEKRCEQDRTGQDEG